jgi:hypothetical protein
MKTLLFITITPFILGVLVSIIELIYTFRKSLRTVETLETVEYDPVLEDRKDNLDRQIDGYNQLLIMLDRQYREETDPKKLTAIMSKQLTTLEKYNRAMEKRKKLGE